VNESPQVASGAEVAFSLETVMLTIEGLGAGGLTAEMVVGEITLKLAAATDPNLTSFTEENPEPVMVTEVPPETVPDEGLTISSTGGGAAW
jgi:hypothetical protein